VKYNRGSDRKGPKDEAQQGETSSRKNKSATEKKKTFMKTAHRAKEGRNHLEKSKRDAAAGVKKKGTKAMEEGKTDLLIKVKGTDRFRKICVVLKRERVWKGKREATR